MDIYQTGSSITFVYQAPNVTSGAIIYMEVYDETHTLDTSQSNTTGLTEIMKGTIGTGRYHDYFQPDAEGIWVVCAYKVVGATKTGHVVAAYEITSKDIKSIGNEVSAIKARTDLLPDDPADQSAVQAAITTSEGNIRGTDADTLKTLSDQIDTLESPAMVG